MSNNWLRRMGFCGVDDSVAPELLCLLSKQYPWIEWGVLFRSDLEGTPRYPTWNWVESLFRCKQSLNVAVHLAAHLCRDRCQQVIEGDSSFVDVLANLGFERMQINATAANGVVVERSRLAEYANNIRTIANKVPSVEFIFQFNDETQPIWEHLVADVPSNVSILYDASCGKGLEIQTFPSPARYPVKCGYAGGIGPASISRVLPAVRETAAAASFPVWIDMESSLRVFVSKRKDESAIDEFSINNCMICILAGVQHGLPQQS